LNSKMTGLIRGAIIIVIATIVGGIQILHIYNIYGAVHVNKWIFYGVVAIVGIIGIIQVAYSALKEKPKRVGPIANT
jgi:intracellular septation protein A